MLLGPASVGLFHESGNGTFRENSKLRLSSVQHSLFQLKMIFMNHETSKIVKKSDRH
jgi:hypothetical protein